MNTEQYMIDSARTVSGAFHSDRVNPLTLWRTINDAVKAAELVDQAKKALFYGKPTRTLRHMDALGVEVEYSDAETDLLHAALGIITEAAEIGDVVKESLVTAVPIIQDRAKLIDETGDLLWYVALLLRKLGVSFEDVMAANIAKLQVRFPEKFTEERAVNRDDAAERAVFVA